MNVTETATCEQTPNKNVRQRLLIFYDFEVFKQDYLCVFICPQEKWERVIINDRQEFVDFYEEHKNDLFVGFNSKDYDVWIYRAIIAGIDPYLMSKFLISDRNAWNPSKKGNRGSDYDRRLSKIPFNNYDVYLGNMVDKGLKSLESNLGLNIKETDVDFDLDRKLTQEEIDLTVKYCHHDVASTIAVFLERIDTFEAYLNLISYYPWMTMEDFGRTRAQLAATILDARRPFEPFTDEWDFILPECLQLGKYAPVKEWFLNPENHDYSKSLIVHTKSCDATVAFGGIHDTRTCLSYKNCKLLNVDVSSYYPHLMVVYGLLSRAIQKPEVFTTMVHERLKWKKTNPKLAKAVKVPLNAVFGASKDIHGALLDKRMANSVCISGQLLLLDLIDKIEDYCEILNINTDGLLVKCDSDEMMDKVKELAGEWEKRSQMPLEYEEYTTFISRDVNTYLLVDVEGEIKAKGAAKFNSALDNNMSIINKCIQAYFLKDITPEEFIENDNDLMDYMNTCKLKGDFTKMYHMENGELVALEGKVARVFASKREGDGFIARIRETNRKQSTLDEFDLDYIGEEGAFKSKGGCVTGLNKFANTSDKVFIDNGDIRGVKCPEYLDKQYYIDLAWNNIKMWLPETESGVPDDLLA